MTLTLRELEQVAIEINELLQQATLVDIRPADKETVVMSFDKAGERIQVLFCVRPRFSRMHRCTTLTIPKRVSKATPFFSIGRRFLGKKLRSVRLMYGDRVTGFEFVREVRGKSKGTAAREVVFGLLIFECTGHHPNLFWTEPNEVILASLVPSRSYKRDLRPGRKYQKPLPHPSDKMEAMRFLPGPSETMSEVIERHYGQLSNEEKRKVGQAIARRELKKQIERLSRLREGLEKDLAEQEKAASLLESMEPPYPERIRRLAARRAATFERIRRITRKIERLLKGLEDSHHSQ